MKHASATQFSNAPSTFKIENDFLIIVAELGELTSNNITLQDFIIDGNTYIPIFTEERYFDQAFKGTQFYKKGIRIKRNILFQILNGSERLLLNGIAGDGTIANKHNLL